MLKILVDSDTLCSYSEHFCIGLLCKQYIHVNSESVRNMLFRTIPNLPISEYPFKLSICKATFCSKPMEIGQLMTKIVEGFQKQ